MVDPGNLHHRRIWFLIIILFVNIILISSQIVLPNDKSLIHNVGIGIIAPFQKVLPRMAEFVVFQFNHYIFNRRYHRKYLQAQRQIDTLTRQKALLERKHLELEFSRIHADIPQESYLRAEVILVDVDFPLNSVLIDQGYARGVRKNLAVISPEGHLVGKTVEPITMHTAKVRLITSSIGGVGAYIKTNRLEGFLTGENSPVCQFKYVIGNASVKFGEEVVTSGTDRIFPPFIPVGVVSSVQEDYLEKSISVDPFFIHHPIKYVLVLTDEKKKN